MTRVAVIAGLVLGWLGTGPAAAEEAIRVVRVTPVVVDGMLGAEVQCESLFSPKSLSTLQCGLSAALRLELRLMGSTGARTLLGGGGDEFETVHEAQVAKSISYNVWDERYTVRTPGQVEVFADLEDAERAAATFAPDGLVPLEALRAGVMYRIRARVQLLPISQEQGERIADWLRGPERLAESTGAAGGGSFGFDVNGLVSALLGRGQARRDRSDWHECTGFGLDPAGGLTD